MLLTDTTGVSYRRISRKIRINKAKLRDGKRDCFAHKKTITISGGASDVFSLGLAFSVGDISCDGISENRLNALNYLFSPYPNNIGEEAAKTIFDGAKESLNIIKRRTLEGESIRIWYSDNPDEICGFYWFLAQIASFDNFFEKIYAVRLPEWEIRNGAIVRMRGWGEVQTGEWRKYIGLQKELPRELILAAKSKWEELQAENSPLRAVVNGNLCSVPEDFYDSFISAEIKKCENEFYEAKIIGRIMGKYQLKISDGYIAARIEKMIDEGKLSIVTHAAANCPDYDRVLKRTGM